MNLNKIEQFLLTWLVAIALGLIGSIIIIRYLNGRDLKRKRKNASVTGS